MSTPEKRMFSVHPGIIKHLIREQAGTLGKAFAELVMNSIDAGATRVELQFNDDATFSIKDDGRGFRDRNEIEHFFEAFGTPHAEGDAKHGRFRVGRGQIMAYANTLWRSGHFTMDVRLLGEDTQFGYQLTESKEHEPGCLITGRFECDDVDPSYFDMDVAFVVTDPHTANYRLNTASYELRRLVRYVDTPVFINGSKLNTDPKELPWTLEDDNGYYLFDKSRSLVIYSQGIFVTEVQRSRFSVGGVFVSKKAIKLNIARNSWDDFQCDVMRHFSKVAHADYLKAVERGGRLTEAEITTLFCRIADEEHYEIDFTEKSVLFKTRFIPVVGGEKVSPQTFLKASRYSLYDGESSLIAERAISEGDFSLFVPSIFHMINEPVTDKSALAFLRKLTDFFAKNVYISDISFVSFSRLRDIYSGTFELIPDNELSMRGLAAIKSVKRIIGQVARLVDCRDARFRKVVAGRSDCAGAWTDGLSYIAFNESTLEEAYLTQSSGGIERLVNHAIHEYCHQAESSVDTHEHSLAFYKRYHDATLSRQYAEIVRNCHRFYLRNLTQNELRISSDERRHANALRDIADSMDKRHPKRKRLQEA